MEESIPEESVNPDTAVVLVPDHPVAPADSEQTETQDENGTTASINSPDEVFLYRNCPLNEKLRDMRVETRRYTQNQWLLFALTSAQPDIIYL